MTKGERIQEAKRERYDEALYLTDKFIAEIGKLNRRIDRKIAQIEREAE